MKKQVIEVAFLTMILVSSVTVKVSAQQDQPAYRKLAAKEISVPLPDRDEGYLGRPKGMRFVHDRLYIVDSADDAVKIFSREGRFLKFFGRRGQGPGEFNSPGGLDVFEERIYVADSSNRRIQIFDLSGKFLGAFPVSKRPIRVYVLSENIILMVILASGHEPNEKMLLLTDFKGKTLRAMLDAHFSGRTYYDIFRNRFTVLRNDDGGFFVVHNCCRREILRFDGRGDAAGSIKIDDRFPRWEVTMPLDGRRTKIEPLYHSCAGTGEYLYFVLPEIVPGRDVTPSKKIILLDYAGRLAAEIDLPVAVTRIEPVGSRIYALDTNYDLRIFEIAE